MKKGRILTYVIYAAVLAAAFSFIVKTFVTNTNTVSYSEVVSYFRNEKVTAFYIEGKTITMSLSDGNTVTSKLADLELFYDDVQPLLEEQTEKGILKSYDIQPASETTPYSYILPIVIGGGILLLVWFLLAGRMSNNNPMASFGKAKVARGTKEKVTFGDVAGVDEEKNELEEVVDFLKDPGKFAAIGAKIPHGVLLSGPPGTGKTMLAKAVAGEAGVPFLSISGSDFMEMYVGVGASRVRDLFDQAKHMAPAIIFIDEIDAVGRKRGSGMGGGHDEREQTLNQLLVEMDGFTRTDGVIVIAATNRPDILDNALLRPGRFDRRIYVDAPDARGREAILKVHAKNKNLSEDVNLKTIAMVTTGFTGADLSNLLNEGAITAARNNRPVITMEDLNQAMMKIIAGPEKRSRLRLERDKKLTAVHEAGHAVAMYSLPTHDPVHQISIIPRGRALGLTWTRPTEESTHMTRNEMYENIVGLLGGRVAESLFLGDISTGASNDIDRASAIARDMIARYGMNEALGTVSYTGGDELFIGRDFEKTKSYSEEIAGSIDREVKKLMDKAYEDCASILRRDAEKLQTVVAYLTQNETMTGEQFRNCMEGKEIGEAKPNSFFDEIG